MAQFRVVPTPPYGVCLTCGTSACARGFVDMVASVNTTRENYEISGTVDVIICADCMDQAVNAIGGLSIRESEIIKEELINTRNNYEKAADEVASWQQRYENLVEIMSLLELAPKNGNSLDSVGSGEPGAPSADLHVPEGEPKPAQKLRKTAKQSIS